MRIRFCDSLKRLFLLRKFFLFLLSCFLLKQDCQGHSPSVSHLSLKFKTSYMTCRSSACSTAARNPREITISLAFVCREPSCIKKTEFSTQVLLPALLYINLYSERDSRLVTFSYSSSQWSIYDASFCFFDTSFHSSSIHLELESVPSCQSLRNEGEKQSKSVGVMRFTVYHFAVYHAMHINCSFSCVWRHCGPLRQLMWQWEVWLQCDTVQPLGGA